MRLKSADGPLQAVHNGNNDILNSPKRINTIQNSNYTQNTQNISLYGNVTTNEISNITKNIQQLTIEDVAALNNVHNDTQELRWCNSDLTTTGGHDQQLLNYQRQLALSNLANNRLNINSNLAARLRLRAQNAQNAPPTYKECQMPQSPDDIPIDEDENHRSCSSSTSASPQDEDRAFDPSDSADSSDEGNDYSRPRSTDIRPNTLKGFVNPNYPGFQHLAHTLDFDDETLNNANNNNEEYEVADKFDSVNRLDSVENIQKVFHDKSLDIDVDRAFPSATETDQDSPNGSSSANCDSESECGGTIDSSTSNDESRETVNENFNIRIDEKKVFASEKITVVPLKDEKCFRDEVTLSKNDDEHSEIINLGINSDKTVDDGTTVNETSKTETANDNTNVKHEEKCIDSVVGNFREEVEDELGRVYAKENDSYEPHIINATEIELEEAVEKLQVIINFQPSAVKYLTEHITGQPSSKEQSPAINDQPLVCDDTQVVKSPFKIRSDETIVVSEQMNNENMSTSLNFDPVMEAEELKMTKSCGSDILNQPLALENYDSIKTILTSNKNEVGIKYIPGQNQSRTVQNNLILKNNTFETPNQNIAIQDKRTRKQVPSFLPLNQKTSPETAKQILSPIENKMADAMLSNCQEHIAKIIVERPNLLETNHGVLKKAVVESKLLSRSRIKEDTKQMEVDDKILEKESKNMEVDIKLNGMDLGRRDSNRELDEIEIQIKKIKSDTICNMEEAERFRKEDLTKGYKEKDEDCSVIRRNPPKMNTYVKKRRDYNQQFGSLITFPKRESVKRDPLNRRSVPMVRDRKKITNPEYLGGFDVYNIETAMPKIDLEAIECHLRAATEEERRFEIKRLSTPEILKCLSHQDVAATKEDVTAAMEEPATAIERASSPVVGSSRGKYIKRKKMYEDITPQSTPDWVDDFSGSQRGFVAETYKIREKLLEELKNSESEVVDYERQISELNAKLWVSRENVARCRRTLEHFNKFSVHLD